MKVLVGCEFSGVVRDAFIRAGHNAVSCDLLPSESDFGPHIQDDILNHLEDGWDLAIFHPTCRYLSRSGMRWLTQIPKHPRPGVLYGPERVKAMWAAVEFTRRLYDAPIPRVAIENPQGLLSTYWRKPDQTIQPWWFGDPAFKATCLWKRGLPNLQPTNKLTPPAKQTPEHAAWSQVHRESPGPEREKNRSRTYPGFGQAMAQQWGAVTRLPESIGGQC